MQTKPAIFLQNLFKDAGVTICLNLERKHNILVHQAINSLISHLHYKIGMENYWNSYFYTNRWWAKSHVYEPQAEPQQSLRFFSGNRPLKTTINHAQENLLYKAMLPPAETKELLEEYEEKQQRLDKQVGFNSLLYWSNSYLTFYKTYLSSNSTYIESYFNPGAEFSVTKLKQEINDNYLLLTPRTNFIYSSQLHTSLGYLYKKEYL
ncbi:hypothetical protein, partial [Psittacicella gerlachiana]